MTATASAAPAATSPPQPVSFAESAGDLLRSEWTKIRSVRSTIWTLLALVVVSVGLTALFSWLSAHTWPTRQAASRDTSITADPVSYLLGTGIDLGQLAICVIGVLSITSEFSTGVIRASLIAVPKRVPMMAAKAAVLGGLILVLSEVVTFGSFFAGMAFLHSRVSVSLGNPDVLRAVVGTGLAMALLAVFALSIGALIRNTAGGIAATIGIVIVLPILTGLLPGSWGAHLNGYLPEQAGGLITQAHRHAGQVLTPWQGFGIFCLWTALLLAAAAYTLRKRDI
jgi:ABC-2 type transport system permease protein